MSRQRPRSASAAAGSAVAADYEDVSRFEQLLESYFKPPAKPKAAATTKKKTKPNTPFFPTTPAAQLPPTPQPRSPEDDLKALKKWLRNTSPASQSKFTAYLFDATLQQLKRAKRSAVVFTRVITLCTELFARSVAFRALVAANAASFYERLLDAAGESRIGGAGAASTSAQLTAQVQVACIQNAQLQSVLAMLEAWKEDFGDKYPPIAAGHAALEQKGFVFPLIRQKRLRDAQQDAESRQLRQRIRQAQIEQMERAAPEIEDVIVEMNRIFDILVPTLDAFNLFDDLSPRAATDGCENKEVGGASIAPRNEPQMNASAVATTGNDPGSGGEDDDGVDWEDVPGDEETDSVEWEDVNSGEAADYDKNEQDDGDDDYEKEDDGEEENGDATLSRLDMNQIVQAYGLGSSSYQLTIEIPTHAGMCEKSSDNEVLFRHLADGILRIRKRFLPLVREWKQHIQQHDNNSNSTGDSALDRAMAYRVDDLQHRLDLIVSKWEDLVEESEKKRFAKITPSVISLPLSAYAPRQAQALTAGRKRRRVVLLQDARRGRPKP